MSPVVGCRRNRSVARRRDEAFGDGAGHRFSAAAHAELVEELSHVVLRGVLRDDDVKHVVAACRHVRDKLLIRLLAETGMRIGQALGLRHSDIKSWDNEIWIVSRDDNVNEVRAKRAGREPLRIDVDPSLMRLYGDYLIDELGELDTDYGFVNLWRARSAAR